MCRPRVILVSREGRLVGLVTVKDVLRHEAIAHHRSSTPRPPPSATTQSGAGPGHSRNSSSSWAGWNEEWQEIDVDVRGNGLEYALEVGLGWIRKQVDGIRGRSSASGIRGRRDPTDNPAYAYELSGDRPT